VSDIFREVDEEVRREQLQKLWDRYQSYVVAVIALILIGVAGWRGYEYWQDKLAAAAGSAFEAAVNLANEGKHAEAEAAFGKVAVEGTASYRVLARVRQAAELSQTDAKAAVAAYERIAADGSIGSELRDLAGVRAGALLIDADSFADARTRLEPLAGEKRTYRYVARELLALAAWRAGDIAAAKRWFDVIVTDVTTPPESRSRVEMLVALTATEGKS
jgi:hypothetical protein